MLTVAPRVYAQPTESSSSLSRHEDDQRALTAHLLTAFDLQYKGQSDIHTFTYSHVHICIFDIHILRSTY